MPMNVLSTLTSFLNRRNFRRVATKHHLEARDTDIKLSREILGLSQAQKDTIWMLLDCLA
jgi:hypothetical protein